MYVFQLVVFAEERRTFLSALMDAYDSLKTDTLFLLVFLDRYISASAIAMGRSRLFASSERGTTPNDTVVGRSSEFPSCGTHTVCTASRMRSATSRAPSTSPFTNKTNSSPPWRPTRSSALADSRRILATQRRISSPAPWLSL